MRRKATVDSCTHRSNRLFINLLVHLPWRELSTLPFKGDFEKVDSFPTWHSPHLISKVHAIVQECQHVKSEIYILHKFTAVKHSENQRQTRVWTVNNRSSTVLNEIEIKKNHRKRSSFHVRNLQPSIWMPAIAIIIITVIMILVIFPHQPCGERVHDKSTLRGKNVSAIKSCTQRRTAQ